MIPVNEPLIAKHAQKYVLDCLKTGWVSSAGHYITDFEREFSRFIGSTYAVTTTNGTTALHLALASLGIGKGDEVIIPDLTIISCALAVIYTGATPVLVDVERRTGNIDPSCIEQKITKKTKAIMVVHLYGHPVDLRKVMKIAKKHKLLVIEDAAQAHGAMINMATSKNNKPVWKRVGSIGDVGCFSFYGNKIVTTGEGGMVVTNNKAHCLKMRLLKDLAHSPSTRFLHEEVGFNYRMTNLQAALGLAQLEMVEPYIKKKRWMAKLYTRGLSNITSIELPVEENWARSVYWMYSIKVKADSPIHRDEVCLKLRQKNIDTRNFFLPIHSQPVMKKLGFSDKSQQRSLTVSEDLANRGFYIPSGLAITQKQINEVINALQTIFTQT